MNLGSVSTGLAAAHCEAYQAYAVFMDEQSRDRATQRLNAAATAADIELALRDFFEFERDANEWWVRPHPMLDGAAPCDVSVTSDGVRRVRRVLVGLRYGFAV